MSELIPKFEILHQRASQIVEERRLKYIDHGADDEITLLETRKQWRRLKLMPRIFTGCDASSVDISCTLLGKVL